MSKSTRGLNALSSPFLNKRASSRDGTLLLAACLLHALASGPAWAQPVSPETDPALNAPLSEAASIVSLELTEVQSLPTNGVTKIAIGKPEIIDVTVLSANEVLLQAKQAGMTNVILWDADGKREWSVVVIDRGPEVIENQLRQLVSELNLPNVRVVRQGEKIFTVGQVMQQEEMDRLEQALVKFKDITNLVAVLPSPPPLPEPPPPMVKLSAQLIEISRTDMEKIGIDWADSLDVIEQPLGVAPKGDIDKIAVDTTPYTPAFDSGAALQHRLAQGLRVGKIFRQGVTAKLNAMIQHNKARVLAEPKLVTASGKEAYSLVGLQVPVISSTSINGTSVEFKDTGVTLKMTPTIRTDDPDRRITTTIEAEVSSVDRSTAVVLNLGGGASVPGFKVRKTTTEVTTLPGETVMISGLIEAQDSNEMSGVPGLSNIPVFGRLFRTPAKESTQRELVLAVTPELLADEGTEADRTLALEQALSMADISIPTEDPRLRYALQVQQRIAKAIRFPSGQQQPRSEGMVKLRLHLFADGTLGVASVTESSGSEALDAEALKAAESQSPYPGFPSQLTEKEIWLDLPVIFRPS